jgi:branched-chain amino acid transport system ATP-binding protein
MSLALELSSIDAGYGEMPVLFGVNLGVPKGSIVALLGPNGSGKTTALRVASGLLRPKGGRIVLNGRDVTGSGPRQLAKQGTCLIPEGRGIFPNLTVSENILLHTHLRGRKALADIEEKAFSRFPRLGERRSQVAGTLSGGEQQMLSLSRALTATPSVLLLDEISMGLAPLVVESLFGVVRDLVTEGVTVLLVEQLVQDALEISDYVVLLNQGRVRAVGEPGDIRDQIVGSYLGGEDAEGVTAAALSSPALEDEGALAPVTSLEEAAQAVGANGVGDASAQALVSTPHGTMAHRRACPIAVNRGDLRPAEDSHRARPCGMCGGSADVARTTQAADTLSSV